MLRSLLIANRGEIALRVMRTCRRLGIRTIAVYSDADAAALHVSEADSAFRIGPAPATDSYLNIAAVLGAARQGEAEAIHPGYGFLAENPEFAQASLDAGLIWVGPSPAAMRAVGDKARAKVLAEQHGVPVLAGYHGADQDPAVLEREAERIGFPVLIKASAGGGGRGMRVVEDADGFQDALDAARREAMAAFGDKRVLLERYVGRPRHVEVQVLADQHGNLVHLGERECSIQRRHQKLIEETPSLAVDAQLRSDMGQAALRLMRAADYANAGTVEFLLEPDGQFAFLEVNARLQVEHPVTEAVTGLDLVELQLWVAAGESLPIRQEDVCFVGHAIEVRVIAEDPLADFLPSSGRVDSFIAPDSVRTDTWLTSGTVVSPYYDSLLAKLVAHGSDRPGALHAMRRALQDVVLEGVRDNIDLLLWIVEHPAFKAGDLHTSFLDDQHVLEDLAELPPEVLAIAARPDLRATDGDPWRARTAWRQARIGRPIRWQWAGREHEARAPEDLERQRGDVSVRDRGEWRIVEWQGRTYRLRRPQPETAWGHAARGASGQLTAPMPGRIVKLAVEERQQVTANQPLVVLEAMKMEHVVEAPHAGVVTRICVQPGEQVHAGTLLLELGEPLE